MTVAELAARWKVSQPTARNTTRRADFPPMLVLGLRALRWPEEEVDAWERISRVAPARHVTKSMPLLRVSSGRQPAKVRTIRARTA